MLKSAKDTQITLFTWTPGVCAVYYGTPSPGWAGRDPRWDQTSAFRVTSTNRHRARMQEFPNISNERIE